MTEMLKFYQTGQRIEIKYVCAPGCSGKTSSVLPAFLASDYFTHYLYIAFDNNESRTFGLSEKTPLLDNSFSAEEQGAKFAVECMRILLEEPDRIGPYEVPVGPSDLPSIDDSRDEMISLLDRNLGANAKVLIHLDEHRKMCPCTNEDNDPDNEENDPGAAFFQGAMFVFGGSQAVVVATYVEPPPLSPPGSASVTCRWPVVCPRIDVELVMRHLAGPSAPRLCSGRTDPLTGFRDFLELKQTSDDQDIQRLIANLKLRFALALQERLAFLHVPQIDGLFERKVVQLSDDLKVACSSTHATDRKEKLRTAADSFSEGLLDEFSEDHMREVDKHVARMLCGMYEEEVAGVRRVSDLIVLGSRREDLLTAPLSHFLSAKPPDDEPQLQKVYVKGAKHFKAQFDPAFPLIAGTPLERSYLWALSTQAALYGELKFGKIDCPFKCSDIKKKGRIFPGQDPTKFDSITDVSQLETDVMFFADEEKDEKFFSHPRCNIWYRTSDGEKVVLIEITDKSGDKVQMKAEGLGEVVKGIQAEQEKKKSGVQIRGVVLAPSDSKGDSYVSYVDEVVILRADRARELLGGLDQVFQYVKQ
uniref:Uncharacterized protein n=1 Tax=Chromera velia CCMP2878 TaxID=1169474 RepID=A0A0G4G1L1_9ALVE|eukprot:Cvel_19674.t1-p1 / transcript=Cvel_19674.t1 / gene=Cvel_19674 / organism=Chromera_velia_CCMP2878 / gene_product=hypothetical protein / transcript_product=hypothetical protein / location=Cvel_scaffold1715:15388-17838(-) / protein_length=587 / sequence_SO=supercontig / SO=protein_coding / is_pseudo=false